MMRSVSVSIVHTTSRIASVSSWNLASFCRNSSVRVVTRCCRAARRRIGMPINMAIAAVTTHPEAKVPAVLRQARA